MKVQPSGGDTVPYRLNGESCCADPLVTPNVTSIVVAAA
jgi:hypothetical protein